VNGRLLTARQVADHLGVNPETILRRWRAGEFPGYRLSHGALRFAESDIDEWLQEKYRPASIKEER
jgi:excisionase family DNA binding protein